MKKKLIVLILIVSLLAGCGTGNQKNPAAPNSGSGPNTTENSNPGNSSTSSTTGDTTEKNSKSVYTGEEVTKESYENTPFMAIIENIKAARPQSGLSDADIVFETMAEGGIPRMIAIFQSKKANVIGPIRSDRPYFNELAHTYNLPFAHCGGYQVALDEIRQKHLMSLNEMANGSYYRRDHSRKAPHNLYTSSDKLIKLISKKNYNQEPKFNLNFDDSYWQGNGTAAKDITVKFSGYYSTAYTYSNGRYYKTMNGVKVPDRNNGEQLSAKNVIVEVTRITPIPGDAKDRVRVKLTGSGDGYVFSNGLYKKMHWKKDSETSQTQLTDENGNEIKLSVGNTWWEIMDKNGAVTIK